MLKQLRKSPRDKHAALLKEIQEFIQSKSDVQDFLDECISSKAGLFDLLRCVIQTYSRTSPAKNEVVKTIRLVAITYRGGPIPVFQLMFSLFSKSRDMNMGLMDTFLAIIEPSVIGPVVFESFIPTFMVDLFKFVRCGMPSYNLARFFDILITIFDCYPKVFDEFFGELYELVLRRYVSNEDDGLHLVYDGSCFTLNNDFRFYGMYFQSNQVTLYGSY